VATEYATDVTLRSEKVQKLNLRNTNTKSN